MPCWRVLELSGTTDDQIPQLLIKPDFGPDSYVVYLTDLSNIWCEELPLDGILDRASKEESPIEVSKQDTTQLRILLDNVQKSLANSDDTCRHITRSDINGVTIHTTVSLPEPLDSLRWKFHFEKRSSIALRNELILPLLVSSHIQHERVNSLIANINEKDKAITRLIDQYESSNLDLAAAFPSIGGLKSGRRLVRREQAARRIPALQPFNQDSWKKDTEQLNDSEVSTLGLFQEALSQCTPKVPSRLKSDGGADAWWTNIRSDLESAKILSKAKSRKALPPSKPETMVLQPREDETEDEFEIHENFKTREAAQQRTTTPEPGPLSTKIQRYVDEDESTEDDEDLDVPPKNQSRNQKRTPPQPVPSSNSLKPEASPLPSLTSQLVVKPKGRDFKIGGKARTVPVKSPLGPMETEPIPEVGNRELGTPMRSKDEARCTTPTKEMRKTFKIGGKKVNEESVGHGVAASSASADLAIPKKAPSAGIAPPTASNTQEEGASVKEEREETPEERAERKRRELKRKNEEIAKKQAQSKKKKRF